VLGFVTAGVAFATREVIGALSTKDEVSCRVIEDLPAVGIEVASATSTVTVRPPRSGGDG